MAQEEKWNEAWLAKRIEISRSKEEDNF